MIDSVIFDLDGTLLNTLSDLTAATNHALAAFGQRQLDEARVRRYVGNGVPKLIERALYFTETGDEPDFERGNGRGELFSPCLAVFTEYYDKHNADLTAPYDGVAEMLSAVKAAGYRSAIVTNKYDGAAQALKAKFFNDVDTLVGAAEGIRPKPAPDGVKLALERIGSTRDRAVYVGDGDTDIATARNCGMPVIAVAWGFRDRDYLLRLGPDYLIDSPDRLLPLLKTL